MKKSILLVMVALFAVSAHAQDSVNRSVGVYFDAYSGDVVNDNLGTGSCFEFGVSYSQNFSSAQWLKMTVTGLTAVSQRTMVKDDKWVGNMDTDTTIAASPRAKLHLNFGGFGYVAADTRSLVALGGGYGHNLGNAGTVSYGADVCLFAVPTLKSGTYYTEGNIVLDGYTTRNLDLFQVHVGYSVPFAEQWGFATKLMFRFSDEDAFVESFRIRWDNTVSYSVNGMNFWGKVRYQIDNIANNDEDILNQVYLQAGISYGFDFSNN